ncbi:MAG: hypothetical protein M3N49_14850 [Candidatus Eremiobacteraeota bacterium]|nr:hypothetical protein [Candidatus Eremiobacteraeota bacterium]
MRCLRFSAAAFAFAALLAVITGADAASRYAGTYTTQRPGADSTQLITLELQPNGRASLTTRYPDLERSVGPSVLPIIEIGTWRDRGATAEVRLVAFGLLRDGRIYQSKRDNNVIVFALQHCLLRSVRYSKVSYGEAGLSMDKANCR